jgi:hypothetical protein
LSAERAKIVTDADIVGAGRIELFQAFGPGFRELRVERIDSLPKKTAAGASSCTRTA